MNVVNADCGRSLQGVYRVGVVANCHMRNNRTYRRARGCKQYALLLFNMYDNCLRKRDKGGCLGGGDDRLRMRMHSSFLPSALMALLLFSYFVAEEGV